MKRLLIFSSIIILIVDAVSIIGRTQSAGIKGTLMCNDKPAANVKVKLYDDDRGLYLFFF